MGAIPWSGSAHRALSSSAEGVRVWVYAGSAASASQCRPAPLFLIPSIVRHPSNPPGATNVFNVSIGSELEYCQLSGIDIGVQLSGK